MVNEITLKNTVRNTVIFESSDEEEEGGNEIYEQYDQYDSPDEETDEVLTKLEPFFEDIATLEVVGREAIKINFIDNRIGDFVDKKEKCDFDLDEEGYPLLPDGGEEFVVPYLDKLSKKMKDLKGYNIETNIKGFKFKI